MTSTAAAPLTSSVPVRGVLARRTLKALGGSPPGVGALKDAVLAEVGSREYAVLAETLREFAASVFAATLGPAFVISRGEVTRAMGDH